MGTRNRVGCWRQAALKWAAREVAPPAREERALNPDDTQPQNLRAIPRLAALADKPANPAAAEAQRLN